MLGRKALLTVLVRGVGGEMSLKPSAAPLSGLQRLPHQGTHAQVRANGHGFLRPRRNRTFGSTNALSKKIR